MAKARFLLLTLLPGTFLLAQDNIPRATLFTGYSFSRGSVDSNDHNVNGWGANFSAAATRYLAIAADFSGRYGSDSFPPVCEAPPSPPFPPCPPFVSENFSAYHFLFGPRFSLPNRRVTPFAQALFGAVNYRRGQQGNRTEFAMGFGGGVDVPLRKHLAYRIFQADYIPAKRPKIFGGWDYDFRVQTGIVFSFGK